MMLWFLVMRWVFDSEHAVEEQLTDFALWSAVRRAMAGRYPDYTGLGSSHAAMTRDHFRRYCDNHLATDATFRNLYDAFCDESASLAVWMGMFSLTGASITNPRPEAALFGDATVLKARFDAKLGDLQLNQESGELEQKPYDPDARSYVTRDEFGNVAPGRVYGTQFGIIHARLAFERERVITDVFHITNGENDEGSNAVAAVERFQRRVPVVDALIYDMALRGKHREQLYDLGLHLITKTPKLKSGVPRRRVLPRLYKARRPGEAHADVEIWAYDGVPSLRVTLSSGYEWVHLEKTQIRLRTNEVRGKRPNRWYGDFRIPDDARVPRDLRGRIVSIRLNDEDWLTSTISWADQLHSIPRNDPVWQQLYPGRNGTEAINAWIKDRMHGRAARAPAVGARKQHLMLLGAALLNNFLAELAHEERSGKRAA
jgi:hypothetical protein